MLIENTRRLITPVADIQDYVRESVTIRSGGLQRLADEQSRSLRWRASGEATMRRATTIALK